MRNWGLFLHKAPLKKISQTTYPTLEELVNCVETLSLFGKNSEVVDSDFLRG